jgi:hypothetical protein
VAVDLYGLSRDEARRVLLRGVAQASSGGSKPVSEPVFPGRTHTSGNAPDFTGTGEPQESGTLLASPHSDAPSESDALSVMADVRTLASLVSAKGTVPPLSIALLGDWGTGKSTFMLQMRRRVDRLADASRAAGRDSSFVSEVCQIDFNAWHYSDNQVWTGLVERLFRALAARTPAVSRPAEQPEGAAAERDRLLADLDTQRARERELTEDLGRIAARRATHAGSQYSPRSPDWSMSLARWPAKCGGTFGRAAGR